MKVVIASDSYKGCLSSLMAGEAAREGVLSVIPDAEVTVLPVSDGGEGLVDALLQALGGHLVYASVSDPLGRPVKAAYCIAGDLAVIEVAQACGLYLLSPQERNPLVASTRGVGELILDAVGRGCRRFIIGLGGSATVDGGRGMVEAMGMLSQEQRKQLNDMEFVVACDVDSPFIGPMGASRVFGPQKGASPQDVEALEMRMTEWAADIISLTGIDVRDMPGAGAAGGLGGALVAFLGARLSPGIDLVLDAIHFDDVIRNADLVITGEGCSDAQTPHGKTPSGILAHASRRGIPVALVSGAVRDCPGLRAMGFASISAVTPDDMTLAQALVPEVAYANIKTAVSAIINRLLSD